MLPLITPHAMLHIRRAMEKQQDSGKARSIGVSNMTVSKLQALLGTRRDPVCACT